MMMSYSSEGYSQLKSVIFFMFYAFIPVLGLMVFTCISEVFNIEDCHSESLCILQ